MSAPRETKAARVALARASKKAACEANNKFRDGRRRIDFFPSGTAVEAINAAKGKTLSERINNLLAGVSGVNGTEGERIETLVAVEGRGDEIDPDKLLADVLEFVTGADHAIIMDGIEDLIGRATARASNE